MKLSAFILFVCAVVNFWGTPVPIRYEKNVPYYEPLIKNVKQFELLTPDFSRLHPNRFRRMLTGSEARSILMFYKAVPRGDFFFQSSQWDGFACMEFPDGTRLLLLTVENGGAVAVFDDGGAVFLQEELPLGTDLK